MRQNYNETRLQDLISLISFFQHYCSLFHLINIHFQIRSYKISFFLKFLFHSSLTSLIIINDKMKMIFVANIMNSIAIR